MELRGFRLARIQSAMNRVLDRPVVGHADLATIVMGYVATVTFLTGLNYLLPFDTFGLSPSFAVLREWGGEVFWGAALLLSGSHGLTATWLEWKVAAIDREGTSNLPHSRVPSRIYIRLVWVAVSLLWVFIGASFAYAVPYSPGAISYVPLGILSLVISNTARRRLYAGSREDQVGR